MITPVLGHHCLFRYENASECSAQDEFGSSAALQFALATLIILILPTVWLSVVFLLDTRRMLKKADKFNAGMKLLFAVGLITCTGYLIKFRMINIILKGIHANLILLLAPRHVDKSQTKYLVPL